MTRIAIGTSAGKGGPGLILARAERDALRREEASYGSGATVAVTGGKPFI